MKGTLLKKIDRKERRKRGGKNGQLGTHVGTWGCVAEGEERDDEVTMKRGRDSIFNKERGTSLPEPKEKIKNEVFGEWGPLNRMGKDGSLWR